MRNDNYEQIRLFTTAPESVAREAWPAGQRWQPGLIAKNAGTLISDDLGQWRAALAAKRRLQGQTFITRVTRE